MKATYLLLSFHYHWREIQICGFVWSLETLREVRACYRVILWRNLLFSFVLSSIATSFVSRLFYFDRALGEEEKVKEGTALYDT